MSTPTDKKQIPVRVYFLPNGNTAAFNSDDEQVPAAQFSWFATYVRHLEDSVLINADAICFIMPNLQSVEIFRIDPDFSDFNWRTLPNI